jgi:hypothetical protein
MQVHAEYTLYGHFYFLRRLLIERAIKKRKPMGPWRDIWVDVPSFEGH